MQLLGALGLRRRPGASSNATIAPPPADATCRICLDPAGRHGFLRNVCLCAGSMQYVHRRCLLRWQAVTVRDTNNDATRCETCHGMYDLPAPPVALRDRLRRCGAALGTAALFVGRWSGYCHLPLPLLLAGSSALSVAVVELMEGPPAMGWWLAGRPAAIVALALLLALAALGGSILMPNLDGWLLSDRVVRRLLRNIFVQNMLAALSVFICFVREGLLGWFFRVEWALAAAAGRNVTALDASRVVGGLTRRKETEAWLVSMLRGWNLMAPLLPILLLVSYELRRPLLPAERATGPVARARSAAGLVTILVILSSFCILPLVDISAATANVPDGAVEQFAGHLDRLGLLDKSVGAGLVRFKQDGPVWAWPPSPMVNRTEEALGFSASTGGYRRRGHSAEALGGALDHLQHHERSRRQAAHSRLNVRHDTFPPAVPQAHVPPHGVPWTWTMLVAKQGPSALSRSRMWRPQQSFLVEEPLRADADEPEETPPASDGPAWPHTFDLSGAGCKTCNGVYTLDGEHDGVPQYSLGEGDGQLILLRYSMPTGPRYWYLSLATDLHSGKGDVYRAKSKCSRRACVDFPPENGWTDSCTLHGQKCNAKWLEFHRWRVGGPPYPTVLPPNGESRSAADGPSVGQARRTRPTFREVIHTHAAAGDTVLVSPGVHTAGISLAEHVTIRGACAIVAGERVCEPGAPPAVLAGGECGILRWWLRRTTLPQVLSIGEALGERYSSGFFPQECAALWITSPAAIVADLTIASSVEAWTATAWTSGLRDAPVHATEGINLSRPTKGPFNPTALLVSAGSAAVVAHCVIIGGVVVQGVRTSPLLEWLTIQHATTGLLVNNHAAPTVRDVRFKHVRTGVEAHRWATPTLTRLQIDSAQQIGMLFTTEAYGLLSMSVVLASGTCNLAVTTGAAPVITDSLFRLASQTGVLFDDGGKGRIQRCHIVESHYAGMEIRGQATAPDVEHSSIHGGGATGLHVHSGGAGTLTDVTLLANQNGAAEFVEAAQSRLLRCTLGGEAVDGALMLDVRGSGTAPELVDCVIDGSGVASADAVVVAEGAAPNLRGVEVHGASRAGMVALGSVSPRLVGCSLHDNMVGVELVGEGGTTLLELTKVFDNARSVAGRDGGHGSAHNCELSAPGVPGLGMDMQGGASFTLE